MVLMHSKGACNTSPWDACIVIVRALGAALTNAILPCAAVRKPPAAKPRFAAPKKAGAKLGGLGVKKMTKVDDSLFDQAPAEDAPPPAAINALSPTLTVSPELLTLVCSEGPADRLERARTNQP